MHQIISKWQLVHWSNGCQKHQGKQHKILQMFCRSKQQACIFCCLHLECKHSTSFCLTNRTFRQVAFLSNHPFWFLLTKHNFGIFEFLRILHFNYIFQTVTVWKMWHMATKHTNMVAQILVASMNSWNSHLFSFLFIITWITGCISSVLTK